MIIVDDNINNSSYYLFVKDVLTAIKMMQGIFLLEYPGKKVQIYRVTNGYYVLSVDDKELQSLTFFEASEENQKFGPRNKIVELEIPSIPEQSLEGFSSTWVSSGIFEVAMILAKYFSASDSDIMFGYDTNGKIYVYYYSDPLVSFSWKIIGESSQVFTKAVELDFKNPTGEE